MRWAIIFCFIVGCGFAEEDTIIEEYITSTDSINTIEINKINKTNLFECTFKINMNVYLPEEYNHYLKVNHFFSIYWSEFVRGEVVTIDNLSVRVPCSACLDKIYGSLEVLDSQYGKKYWGCGNTQPPLFPELVTSKIGEREYSFIPDLVSQSDICDGKQILVDLTPICEIL